MSARPIPALAASAVLLALAVPGLARAQAGSGVEGARRYTQFCAACHGADGKGGDKAAALATNPSVINRTDSELFRIVHDGTPDGMPPFAQIGDANIAAVIHYLRYLEANIQPSGAAPKGDAAAGRVLFFGKAGCSACHLVQGKGGFIASNLTTYARNRSAGAILAAITSPDSPLVLSSRVVRVVTSSGRTITGVLRNEDAFNLELETQDGRFHFLARSSLARVQYSDHSLMPRDYASRLTPAELDDLVGFLIAASKTPRIEAEQNR